MSNRTAETQLDSAMTVQGALLVADSAVYDYGDMRTIALKTLAHEFRAMRAKYDRMCNLAMARGEKR